MPQSVTKKGLTTIYWGTTASALLPTSGVNPKSVTYTPRENKFGTVDNDKGFEIATILGDDGFDVVAECLWDSAVTFPALGDTILVKRPGDDTGKSCLVVNNPAAEIKATEKNAATITIKAEYRPDRSLA